MEEEKGQVGIREGSVVPVIVTKRLVVQPSKDKDRNGYMLQLGVKLGVRGLGK